MTMGPSKLAAHEFSTQPHAPKNNASTSHEKASPTRKMFWVPKPDEPQIRSSSLPVVFRASKSLCA